MRLLGLEPCFVRREICACYVGAPECRTVSAHTEHEWHLPVEAIADADGVMFLCPTCVRNSGSVGVHCVLCWRPRVPADVAPKPGRWEFHGTGLADLTLSAGSSSILLQSGCAAHFFIERGLIRLC